MGENEYLGSTAWAFDDRFGNRVAPAKLSKDVELGFDFDKIRDDYIAELEDAINQNLPEYDGVTNEHLREMIELSRGKDWSDLEVIGALYSARDRIRGKEGLIDMNELRKEGNVDFGIKNDR